ncbi:MAG: S46 family peptidase [Ignavibacteriaceae bacterium]|jgi:hypothetical protein|nr:S46 family peptidase [Ignavibacteriaceae bacterium]
MMRRNKLVVAFLFVLFTAFSLNAQHSVNYDTVKAQKFDTGKMWSFDYPPVDYLKKTYNFTPDQEWFDDIRLSALRLPGCTSSFVSEDGLMMTNHHCVNGILSRVQQEGENLEKEGFMAKSLAEERKIQGYYVDQLIIIKDVTAEVQAATSEGTNDAEKAAKREAKVKELIDTYNKETGLMCQFVSLFNGGKFAIYGYKRYNDVRLVFAPEKTIAYFGGDFDNFTYPRYNLDCSFLRAYDDNGVPVKSNNYFKFTDKGIQEGEPIFTVGNPGTTQRLKTVAQLEYFRDFTYRNNSYMLDTYYNALEALKSEEPSRADEFEAMKVPLGNSQKVIHMIYTGLMDDYLMARKKDFQRKLQEAVKNDPELEKLYGKTWEAIERTRAELREIAPMLSAASINPRLSSDQFLNAKKLIDLAKQLQKPEEERDPNYKADKIDATIEGIFSDKFDKLVDYTKLWVQLDLIRMNLGENDPLVKKMMDGKKGKEAATYALSKSEIATKEGLVKLANKAVKDGADVILKSNDPFIYFMVNTQDKLVELNKQAREISATEQIQDDLLGQAIFKVYGTTIPPDANFTLRLSDGVLKGFDYNGTKSPVNTTFYGLYDRYHGWKGEYPWNLHKIWIDAADKIDLSTPFNFVSTNDIVGGNSGSAVINKNAEVVGLAFDGNMESIIGNFIYNPVNNRMVAVDARSMLHAFKNVYKNAHLYDELMSGKRSEK